MSFAELKDFPQVTKNRQKIEFRSLSTYYCLAKEYLLPPRTLVVIESKIVSIILI